MKYNIEISKILDKHLPANGQGTEREILRMNLHRDICDLINLLTIPVVVSTCCDDKETALKNKIRLADIDRCAK